VVQEQVTLARQVAAVVPVLLVVAETQEKAEQIQFQVHQLHMQVAVVLEVIKELQHQEVLVVEETVVIQDNKVKQTLVAAVVEVFIHLTVLEERAVAESLS
jgi:hypothetical protein